MKRKPSPATIISLVALFFSVTGAGFAASRYLITSTSQIKPSVRAALKGERGPQGVAGPTGAQGSAGAPGSPGSTASAVTLPLEVFGPVIVLTPYQPSAESIARCPIGYVVVSGGFDSADAAVAQDENYHAHAWIVTATAQGTSAGWFRASADCVSS